MLGTTLVSFTRVNLKNKANKRAGHAERNTRYRCYALFTFRELCSNLVAFTMTDSYAHLSVKDSPQLRKERGAFFTPDAICNFIVDWAVRSPDELILEPSCGEASFMLSAGSRLKLLHGSTSRPKEKSLQGIEIHAASAEAAKQILSKAGLQCDIRVASFFDIKPEPSFDVVVGNPPYVRYQQFSGSARTKGLEAALAHGVRLSLLANAWAPFVVHASQFLKPNGRLGLVLPAELLTVKYAAEVRKFLLKRFASVKLVMFEELVFPDVLEEVVLLLAEGSGPSNGFEVYHARNLVDIKPINRSSWTHFTPGNVDKWTPALVTTESLAAYQRLCSHSRTETLLDWGESYLGAVTGNNKYFTLTAQHAKELGLKQRELLPISPPGSRHLRGLTFTKKAWEELQLQGSRSLLFYPNIDGTSSSAEQYLSSGVAVGVDSAYKCQVRKPWWRVPLVPIPDLFLTYMDHFCPRLITNEARVHHLNSLYGVRLNTDRRKLGRDLLPMSSLNTLTLLGSEMLGRSYGGGILKIEPKEADQLPMPSMELVQDAATELRALRPQLSIALRQGDLQRIVKTIDGVLLRKHLGVNTTELKALRDARELLFARRIGRGKKIRGKNR
jgi:adenine-specific DNA-methyltransferase